MELENVNNKLWRIDILRQIKPVFRQYLGNFTHQKISEDWHFRALAFVREEMTYVFGFNIGFFRREESDDLYYTHVGMNVLVRTNGENPMLRARYRSFFEQHLNKWINMSKTMYTSFRGGVGIEFPRMKKIETFKSEDEIISFLEQSIKKLNQAIYPHIAQNPDNIFDLVVRGAPLWNESIVDIARQRLNIKP